MELQFDRFFQITDESQAKQSMLVAANLLKDFIVPGSSLLMGRRAGNWFWHIHLPVQASLPSKVTVLTKHISHASRPINTSQPGWALHGRFRRNGLDSEQFGRPIHQLLDFPLESLMALVPTDFSVRISLFAKAEPITGLRDAAVYVCLWSDNETIISRIGQWIHAKAVPYNPRNAAAYFCEIGFSELPFIMRVPVYSDTFMPQLKPEPLSVIDYLRNNPAKLTRGLLLAGLPGSGKSTTLKTILSQTLQNVRVESVLIADVKGEYKNWALNNRVRYLSPGQNPFCLKELNVNLFIPPANIRLSAYLDSLAVILSIGGFGGSGILLPGYIKIFLEEYYCYLLLHRLDVPDWPVDIRGQRLRLLNCTGHELMELLEGDRRVFSYINRDLLNFWEENSADIIRRIFGKYGGLSQSRNEIADAIASRINGFDTSFLQHFDNTASGTSIDRLLNEKWCIGLNGLSKSNLQLLLVIFALLNLECLLAGPEKAELSHLFVFEEAHLVAAQTALSDDILTIDALIGQTLERALAEARSKGCSIILTDQMPGTKLLPSVLANTSIKVCHNLLGKDGELMAKAMGLSSETNFSLLAIGECFVKLGDDQPPIQTRIRLVES
ncbi:helicase HerA domain-containing protein [Spirosoma panaciterrae]|uniref:helicase HerA domain-containing protein n=1 Tax=Spirosoma panaciterrae TaxID=496058 RepID=UPI000363FA3E|nr:DUF87 domain-containing protein [Spirosoma panaciterrae]